MAVNSGTPPFGWTGVGQDAGIGRTSRHDAGNMFFTVRCRMVLGTRCGEMASGKEFRNASRQGAGYVSWFRQVDQDNTRAAWRDAEISNTEARRRGWCIKKAEKT